MDKRQRMALLGVAALIAVAAAVIAVASGGDGENGSSATTRTGTTEAQTGGGQQGGPDAAPAPEDAARRPKPGVTEIRVADGEPVGGVAEIDAQKGETVRIDVTSDAQDEMHLHVYDITKPLPAGKRTRLTFEADVEGVVELELHGSGAQIAKITVEP